MPDATWLGSVAAMAIAMSATPGPNNTMVMTSGANYGLARSIPHIAGIVIGFPLMMAVLGVGGQPLLADARVHAILKWLGAAYLLWLAFKIATADPSPPAPRPDARADPAQPRRAARPLSFVQAAAFQWVNPKAWIIAAGALVTFAGPGKAGGGAWAAALLLALIFGLATIFSTTLWTMMGIGAARLLRTARAVRGFNLAMAGLLVLSLVPVLIE